MMLKKVSSSPLVAAIARRDERQIASGQEQLLAGMTVEDRRAWRRERVYHYRSGLWYLPKTKDEKKIVERRKKRYEAYKNAPKPAPLSPEEEVAAAMANWPQCVICLGRMKPHPARWLKMCRPCQGRKIPCGVCCKPHSARWAKWTTDKTGALLALCWKCVDEHDINTTMNPEVARDTHAQRWDAHEVQLNGHCLRTMKHDDYGGFY